MNRINLIKQAAFKVQSGKVLAKPLNYEKLCNNILQSETKRVKLSANDFKPLDFN